MEVGDDEFGELYCDVLRPFSSQNKNGEHLTGGKLEETCSTSSRKVRCAVGDGGALESQSAEEKAKEAVGTVRFEIYLGSSRVLENSFVFSIGERGNKVDSGLNQSENTATGGHELNSFRLPDHSPSKRSEKIVAGEVPSDSCQVDRTERIENSDSEFDWLYGKAAGTLEGHGTDNEPPGDDEVNQASNLAGGPVGQVGVNLQELYKGRDASEEGELSEYAEVDCDKRSDIIAVSNPADARNGFNTLRRLWDVRHDRATPFVEAVMRYPMTNQTGVGFGVKPRPNGTSNYVYYPGTSLLELDLDGLEHRPWRHPSVDASDYFNYGLHEASWKSYCEDFKNLRRPKGKRILAESGLRDLLPSAKLMPQRPRNSTATIELVAKDKPSPIGLKCCRPQDGSFRSLQDKREKHEAAAAGSKGEDDAASRGCCDQENDSKRAKIVHGSSGDDSAGDSISDNEWMCRNVAVDNWFHPTCTPELKPSRRRSHEADRRGFRKGRSKLERWTRHDRDDDNDDDNTSLSSLSPPPRS